MASHAQTLEELRLLLLKKFYPMQIGLVRNDKATAEMVVKYVAVMSRARDESRHKIPQDWSSFELEAIVNNVNFSSLRNLTSDTVRKYISELWASGSFRDNIKIQDDKGA
jgi:hypothetical protein